MVRGTIFNLQITTRVLFKGKIYTLINLSGLILGLTASFLLFVYAINELSYNRSYPDAKHIYRIIFKDNKGNKQPLGPLFLKNELLRKIPEIEQSSRMINPEYFTGMIRIKGMGLSQEAFDLICADPEFIQLFSIRITRGITSGMLEKPNRILISETNQHKLFGNSNPIGKTMIINTNGENYPVTVEGVFQDLPWNSTFKAGFIVNIGLYTQILQSTIPEIQAEWESRQDNFVTIYCKVKNERDIDRIKQQIRFQHGSSTSSFKIPDLDFQPLNRIYLDSAGINNDFSTRGNKDNLLIYITLAIFILLLAGMNYSILSTARAALRFREIGMRKVLGATKKNLRSQLLIESLSLSLLALPFVFILLGLLNPIVGSVYGKDIFLHANLMKVYAGLFIGLTLAVGVISGLYLAVYLSSIKVLTALKSNFYIPKRITLGKILLIIQLIITIMLVISMVIIFQQVHYFLNRDAGLVKENLLMVYLNSDENANIKQFENAFNKSSLTISCTSASAKIPDRSAKISSIKIPGKDKKKIPFEVIYTGIDFFKALGVKIIQGRGFLPSDTSSDFFPAVINQEVLRITNMGQPIGARLGKYTIVGVSTNFNIHTLHTKINPTLIIYNPDIVQTLIIRYKNGDENKLFKMIRDTFHHLAPDCQPDYKFFDQELNS
ncbi:MAG: ABC transporter permease, partial [Bacteroidales bacterium]|nr:ABC transporter permease [Bacteroidales bacterium]